MIVCFSRISSNLCTASLFHAIIHYIMKMWQDATVTNTRISPISLTPLYVYISSGRALPNTVGSERIA